MHTITDYKNTNNSSIQKSEHLPFLSQSPNRVGSFNLPPLLGPPHSCLVPWFNMGSATTNISSCISSSSSVSSGTSWEHVDLLLCVDCSVVVLVVELDVVSIIT